MLVLSENLTGAARSGESVRPCSESLVRKYRMTRWARLYCNLHIRLYLVCARQQSAAKCLVELLHKGEVLGMVVIVG